MAETGGERLMSPLNAIGNFRRKRALEEPMSMMAGSYGALPRRKSATSLSRRGSDLMLDIALGITRTGVGGAHLYRFWCTRNHGPQSEGRGHRINCGVGHLSLRGSACLGRVAKRLTIAIDCGDSVRTVSAK